MENDPPVEFKGPALPPARKRRWPAVLAVTLLLLGVIGGAMWLDHNSPAKKLEREVDVQLDHIRKQQARFNYNSNPGVLEKMKEMVEELMARFGPQNSGQQGYIGSYEVAEALGKMDKAVGPILEKKLVTEPMPAVRSVILEALVHFENPDPTPILEKALASDPSPEVRSSAATAIAGHDPVRSAAAMLAALRNDQAAAVRQTIASSLGTLDVQLALSPLLKALETDADNSVRSAAARSLGTLGDQRAVPVLRPVLAVQNEELQNSVAVALADLKDIEVVPHLISTLQKQVASAKQAATNQTSSRSYANHDIDTELVQALGKLQDARGVPVLLDALTTKADEWTLQEVIEALGGIRDRSAVPALMAKLTAGGKLAPHAANALGEIGGTEVFESLLAFVSEPTGDRRLHAANALGKSGHSAALPVLREGLANSNDEQIRKHAAEALGLIGDPQAIPELINALGANESDIAQEAAWALGHIGDKKGAAPLVGVLKHKEFGVRFSAAFALAGIQDPATIPALREALQDKEERMQLAAACSLAFHGSAEGYDTLGRNLKSRESWQRFAAVVGLFRLGTPEALALIKTKMEDPDVSVRFLVNTGLKQGAPAALTELLRTGTDDFRHYAARMLPFFRDPSAIPALLTASTDAKAEVRNAARIAAVHLEKYNRAEK